MDEFAEFVRGCSPALLRTAYVLTGDRGHAEDLLQEVLARMHRRWRFITGPPQKAVPRVRNLALDIIRDPAILHSE